MFNIAVCKWSILMLINSTKLITKPTVGIDFVVTNFHHKGKQYRLQLWDTAGQ
jgi:GTPase SAR1 family protein